MHALSAETARKLSEKSTKGEKRRGDRVSQTAKSETKSEEQARACVRAGESETGKGWGNAFHPPPPFGGLRHRPAVRARALRLRLSAVLVPSVRHVLPSPVTRCHAMPSTVSVRSVPSVGCRSDPVSRASTSETRDGRGRGGSTPWR